MVNPPVPVPMRRPLSWSTSAIWAAVFVIGNVATYWLLEYAMARPISLDTRSIAWTIGAGVPLAVLLFRYVSIWTVRGESSPAFVVSMAAVLSALVHLWPFDGIRSVAHAVVAGVVSFAAFYGALRARVSSAT